MIVERNDNEMKVKLQSMEGTLNSVAGIIENNDLDLKSKLERPEKEITEKIQVLETVAQSAAGVPAASARDTGGTQLNELAAMIVACEERMKATTDHLEQAMKAAHVESGRNSEETRKRKVVQTQIGEAQQRIVLVEQAVRANAARVGSMGAQSQVPMPQTAQAGVPMPQAVPAGMMASPTEKEEEKYPKFDPAAKSEAQFFSVA